MRTKIAILPKLYDANGNIKKRWFIYFSYRNPKDNKMKRFKVYDGFATLYTKKERYAHAEKLITLAKNNQDVDEAVAVNARRKAIAELGNGCRPLVQKLFEDIGPRYASRNGGYTRILKLGPRRSDGAEMALIELVED